MILIYFLYIFLYYYIEFYHIHFIICISKYLKHDFSMLQFRETGASRFVVSLLDAI